jgi:hypothetical protein
MDLDDMLEQVNRQLAAAAALGDARTQEIAEALATAAGPAVRLAVLAALSAAADEVTASLVDYPGSPAVGIALDGDAIRVDVRADMSADESATAPRHDDSDSSARISLRLPESLKTEIEAAAGREGMSVNSWLVRAAGSSLRRRGGWGGGWPFGPMAAGGPGEGWSPGGSGGHVRGWVHG